MQPLLKHTLTETRPSGLPQAGGQVILGASVCLRHDAVRGIMGKTWCVTVARHKSDSAHEQTTRGAHLRCCRVTGWQGGVSAYIKTVGWSVSLFKLRLTLLDTVSVIPFKTQLNVFLCRIHYFTFRLLHIALCSDVAFWKCSRLKTNSLESLRTTYAQ